MIELAPELMATLQAEADRQGKTVSEIASKAIKELLDPEPWFDINEPLEPPPRVELPPVGATYIASKCDDFRIRVKAVRPYREVEPMPHYITIEYPVDEDGQEWQQEEIIDMFWEDFVEGFGLTIESASNPGFTRVPKECMTAEDSHERHG